MSLWLPHPLFLPFIMVGITILLLATSPLPEFMTALLFFAVAMGPVESSCAGGDAVMYRAGGDTPKRWLFCLAGDRA